MFIGWFLDTIVWYGTSAPAPRFGPDGWPPSRPLLSSVHVLITVIVAWVVVDAGDALNVGIVTNLTKTGTYYLYERTWDHITWGVSNPA